MDAVHPKLHLQPNVFTAHQGVHRRDMQKQELRIIAKIKEKCESYFRESTAKNRRKASHFADFPQYSHYPKAPLRRVVKILRNFAKYCKSLTFSQDFRNVFAKCFFLGVYTYFRSFSHVFAVFAAHATE